MATKTAKMGDHTVTIDVIVVNPERATALLSTMGMNRKLFSDTVEKYKREMDAGRWVQEAEPIKFNKAGQLIDGQHRLWAVIESGTTQKFVAIYGLPDEAFMVLDTGRRRSFKDTISIHRPEAKHLTSMAAATMIIRRWEKDRHNRSLLYTRDSRVSNHDLWGFFEKNEDRIIEAVERGNSLYNHNYGVMPGRLWSLLVWALTAIDEEDAEYFLDCLRYDHPVAEDSPIRAAREMIRTELASRTGNYKLIFIRLLKAWNAYRRGEPLSRLLFRMGGANPEAFPEPI